LSIVAVKDWLSFLTMRERKSCLLFDYSQIVTNIGIKFNWRMNAMTNVERQIWCDAR